MSIRGSDRSEEIAKKVYYSIGEVCELSGLKPHVLRYWESQFDVLSPTKNRGGNRAYRSKDIEVVLLVKHLLYDEKYTIEGANKRLLEMRRENMQTCRVYPIMVSSLHASDVKHGYGKYGGQICLIPRASTLFEKTCSFLNHVLRGRLPLVAYFSKTCLSMGTGSAFQEEHLLSTMVRLPNTFADTCNRFPSTRERET